MTKTSTLVLALLLPAVALAQPGTTDVRVEERDTCESIAARLYGEGARGLEVLHAANPELGPLPHHLTPGTMLHAPAPASLASVERSVERRDPAAEGFLAAHPGDPLVRGTQVRTDDASSAEIAFRDGATVTVRERTLVIVYGGRRRLAQRVLAHAELERGALRSRLGELADAHVEIDTPTSEASLAGAGVVSVEEDGTSRIANHGTRAASVVSGGDRVVIPPDSGVVVRRGEHPSRPRRLLAAPRWLADQQGFAVGLVGAGATLRGGFVPVEGAAGYRVEIARDPQGDDLVAATMLAAGAGAFEAPGIVDPVVYVSVASIDEAGLEGRRSPWRAFSVRLARLVSPGGVDAVLPASGAPRVLPGTWLVAPRGLTCTADGGEQVEIVTLLALGARAIACRDTAGLGEPSEIDVEVALPEVSLTGTLERDRTTTLALTVGGDPAPPLHVLVVDAPDRFRVSRLRTTSSALEVDVTTPIDAPDRVSLTIALLAGVEHVPLATLELPVVSPIAIAAATPEPLARPARPPREEHTVQGAFGDLTWPSMLALRDERRSGLGAWIYAAIADEDPQSPQLRVGGGVYAETPEIPLHFSLATAGDPLGARQPVDRRGSLDLAANVGGLLHDDVLVSVALDGTVFLPTRGEPESLGRVRAAPSVSLSVRPSPWLSLRTRQGALIDVGEGARLWASAIGGDVTPERWLAIGLELDASVGRFADRDGAALTLGAGFELRLSGLELALGVRFGLTDEARALMGLVSGVLSVRVFAP